MEQDVLWNDAATDHLGETDQIAGLEYPGLLEPRYECQCGYYLAAVLPPLLFLFIAGGEGTEWGIEVLGWEGWGLLRHFCGG